MIELLKIDEFIRKNWYKLVRLSQPKLSEYDKEYITLESLFKSLKIKDKKEQEILRNSMGFFTFLKEIEPGKYIIDNNNDTHSKRNDSKRNVLSLISKTPIDILNINVPIFIKKIDHSKTIIIPKKELKLCKDCKSFQKAQGFCSYRRIKRKEFYPACRYVKKDNR